MGLLSFLGNIGGAALAPFTGGASLALGPALGAMSKGKATNRDAKFSGQMDLMKMIQERGQNQFENAYKTAQGGFDNQLLREQEGRTSATDAFKKLLQTQRILNPAPMPQLSKYQAPARQITGDERAGAEALAREVMGRLQGGNPIQTPTLPTAPNMPITNNDAGFRVDPKLLDPGLLEKILGYASPFLTSINGTGTEKAGSSTNYSGGAPNGFGGPGGY